MSSDTADAIPFRSFERLRAETYTDAAAAALLIWDYFLTFDLEVSLMWPSEWSIIKILFFLTRYLPFFDVTLVMYYQIKPNITEETCRRTYEPAGWLIVIGIIIAEIILVVRTWAIWGRGKRIGYALLAASILAVVPVLVIENIFLKSIVFSPHPGPATPGCLLTSANPIIALSFVVVIVFETFVLVLTLIKGVQQCKLRNHDIILLQALMIID
ncbi:hypothetical protein NLI96_g7065 [Meripilus lineatus]|uniref:DUF6533 domain-containing protein n=1 Tax=Meripilus lineatus TaxID=2056292 RepID=A0AAD5V081_9APHY|nr:hypothetical protein NLI96_g7065 [Physisporinus lineatus]